VSGLVSSIKCGLFRNQCCSLFSTSCLYLHCSQMDFYSKIM
jgi:hypothetical protein